MNLKSSHFTEVRARLQFVPRETRDTLFLLGVIALLLLPHLPYLPWWCSSLAYAVLLWRGVLAIQGQSLPSGWWRAGLLVSTLVATYVTHGTLIGREAGVTLVVVLLALKTLELRARRDAWVVFFLGFFTMLTNFFHSQSLTTAAAITVALMGLLTALVNAHMPVGRPSMIVAARTAGATVLLGLPVMLALFMFFPRLSPLWGTPGDGQVGRSGLSNSMRVGNIARLALDDGIAARVKFADGRVPPRQELYWRGPVLSFFDGREWTASTTFTRSPSPANLRVQGPAYDYMVTMEPSNRPWLLVLDAATTAPEVPGFQVFAGTELQWITNRPVGDLVRYTGRSHTRFQSGPLERVQSLRGYLQLPTGSNPRTAELAARMRADPRLSAGGTPAYVADALRRLRSDGYSYTLEPGVYGEHTADEFWFDRKEGFCEHIASAFVVLMRSLGVPARIVTGYQGGEPNEVDEFWVLRQSDAHAWAEVWEEGRGWTRVDPTASVSPDRVGLLRRLSPSPGLFAGAIGAMSPGLLQDVRDAWEAANNRWNQWVLNYTQGRQLDLMRGLGFDSPTLDDVVFVLLGLLVGASLIGAGWALWERSQHDPWLRLLAQARKRADRSGLKLPEALPPRAMAEQLLQRFGAAAKPHADWLLRLEAQRYAPQSPSSLGRLRREFWRLDWPRMKA